MRSLIRGLAISNTLCRMMGSRRDISCESTLGSAIVSNGFKHLNHPLFRKGHTRLCAHLCFHGFGHERCQVFPHHLGKQLGNLFFRPFGHGMKELAEKALHRFFRFGCRRLRALWWSLTESVFRLGVGYDRRLLFFLGRTVFVHALIIGIRRT